MNKLLLIPIFFLLAACSATKSERVAQDRYFWPPLPDRPRVEWIKNYRSQHDIEKTRMQLFWESVIGEDKPNALSKPVEVKSDPRNKRVFVSDVARAEVLVFDELRHELRILYGSTPPIMYPMSICLDGDGNIYVLDRRASVVLMFDQNEKFVKSIDIKSTVSVPLAMHLDVKGKRMLVLDGAAHKVVVFDLSGNHLFSFGGIGETDGKFNLPISITINSLGDIIVADSFNSRVQIFDGNGVFKYSFGTRGDGLGDFQLIKSVAVDSDDNIYIVDGKGHNVQIFNQKGDLLLVLGSFYSVAGRNKAAQGGFAIPVSIDIDSTDMIYVVDQMNSRVQVFRYLSDKYIAAHPIAGMQSVSP